MVSHAEYNRQMTASFCTEELNLQWFLSEALGLLLYFKYLA